MSTRKAKAGFIKPMLLERTDRLTEGGAWAYELKLDGYRAVAFRTAGHVHLRSRNDNDFSVKYPSVVAALSALPNETVIDGEIVALDELGRPSFNMLQNYGSSNTPILYYAFDVLILDGQNVMNEPLSRRRELLQKNVMPRLSDPVRCSPVLEASLSDLVDTVALRNSRR